MDGLPPTKAVLIQHSKSAAYKLVIAGGRQRSQLLSYHLQVTGDGKKGH